MAKVLARDFVFEIESLTTPGSFIAIGSLNSFAINNSKSDADTTTFDSEGAQEHLPASRNSNIKLDGFLDETDPGQIEVEKLSEKVGTEGIGSFRITNTKTNSVRTFRASAVIDGGPSGGNDDAAKWGATLNVTGKITKA